MSLALARSYTANKVAKQKHNNSVYSKIKANEKWVKYSLDVIELTKTLQTASRHDKYLVMEATKIAERKRDYMYRHPNFDLATATSTLKHVRRLLKL